MTQIASKFVPRFLNANQRDHRVQVCTELQGKFDITITSCSELLFPLEHRCTVLTLKQSNKIWSGNRQHSKPEGMSNLWQHEFSADYYFLCFLTFGELGISNLFHLVRLSTRWLTVTFRNCRSQKFGRKKNWLLHHYNAPSHSPYVVRDFMTKSNMTTVSSYPLYSSDLAPATSTFSLKWNSFERALF